MNLSDNQLFNTRTIIEECIKSENNIAVRLTQYSFSQEFNNYLVGCEFQYQIDNYTI